MATYLITHEVDDVNHWLASSRREEFFGPHGITARPFHDPAGSNRVGLLAEIPDMAAFQELMATPRRGGGHEARWGTARDAPDARRKITSGG